MIKVQTDPITGKVLSYSKVLSNTAIYDSDLLIDESEMPTRNADIMLYTDGEFSDSQDDYTAKLEGMEQQIQTFGNQTDYEYFMEQIMAGKTLIESRTETAARREQIESLWNQKSDLIEEHEKQVKMYYLEQNRRSDAALKCKYYSAVILLIKDENRYLKEWLDWHLNLGFDHIYIYDNGVLEHVTAITGAYPKNIQDKVTVLDWSGHHEHIQQDAYNHFLEHFKQDVRWGLFIDSDEFLRFTDAVTTDVNTFLAEYEDYTEVWGYEVEYNANGQEKYEDKPVRERFTMQTDVREGFYYKNFIQVNRIDSMIMHYAYYDEQKHQLFKNDQSNQDLFVIDHYYTKSWEEWKRKITERGGADPNYHKALREFFVYNPDMSDLDTGENPAQAYESLKSI